MRELKKKEINLRAGFMVLFALCFMIFLYAPIELYSYNQDEFWFDLYVLLPVILVLFAGSFLLLFIVLCALSVAGKKIYNGALTLCSITFLCTYIQGNFLVGNLPALDGTEIDWGSYKLDRVMSLMLWVVVTVAVCLIIKRISFAKYAKVAGGVALGMTLMLMITLCSILISTQSYQRKIHAYATTTNILEMSQKDNFIIFMLDAVDSEMFWELMENEPAYQDIFEDFTYYPDTMAAYPFTKHSIPYILSGEWYQEEEEFADYSARVFRTSDFFHTLEEKQYKLGLYEEELPLSDESILRFENVENCLGVGSYVEFAKMEMKLIAYRYAPFELKRRCVFDTGRFGNLIKFNNTKTVFTANNQSFYQMLQNESVTYSEEPCFKLIHLEGAHVPFRYDEEVNQIEDGTYEGNMRACMTITKEYLSKLRESDAYDNSVIIVMADHGYSLVGPSEFGRQNPIFFVKGKGEKHEFQISRAPISYEDLQEAFRRLLDGRMSTEISDYQEGDQRERRFLYYVFEEEDHMYEYVQVGHAYDDDTMIATGQEYVFGE